LLLAFYLAGLAAGALGVAFMCRGLGSRPGPAPWKGVALFITVANLIGYSVGPLLGWFARAGAWQAVLPLVALSAALLGGILPLMTHYAVPPDDRAGSRLSVLYAVNIAGSVAGTLLTGYILLDLLPLRTVALLLALFGLVLALIVLLRGAQAGAGSRWGALGVAGAALAVVAGNGPAFDGLYEKLLFKERYHRGSHFARVVENRAGVIGVTDSAAVFAGGVYDGMIRTDPISDRNGILRAYAVRGIHPAPRRILVIGMSTGAWSQVLANLQGLERLTVVEINPGYLDIVADYPEVASLLENPRVDIVIDDGRRWLRRNPDRRFDVIVANTTFNWRSHSTNLLSVEYLELIRRHLAPGGFYYFNTTDSPHAAKTALTVFPHGLRFRNFVAVSDSPIALDWARLAGALRGWSIDGRPVWDRAKDPGARGLAEMAAEGATREKLGADLESRESVLRRTRGARVITDDNMATEWEHVFPALWLP
jgi:predicted membrane-bound spermidine synthase